jgi:hypothetical protein
MAGIGTKPLQDLPSPGKTMVVPLVSARGPIDEPAGTAVAVVVQNFWRSPSIVAYRRVVIGAVSAFFGYVLSQIIEAGGLDGVDWSKTFHVAVNTGVVTAAMGFAAKMRKSDNNPVN